MKMSIFVCLVHEAHPFGVETQNRSRRFCRDNSKIASGFTRAHFVIPAQAGIQ